jgi:hypothetical protein
LQLLQDRKIVNTALTETLIWALSHQRKRKKLIPLNALEILQFVAVHEEYIERVVSTLHKRCLFTLHSLDVMQLEYMTMDYLFWEESKINPYFDDDQIYLYRHKIKK